MVPSRRATETAPAHFIHMKRSERTENKMREFGAVRHQQSQKTLSRTFWKGVAESGRHIPACHHLHSDTGLKSATHSIFHSLYKLVWAASLIWLRGQGLMENASWTILSVATYSSRRRGTKKKNHYYVAHRAIYSLTICLWASAEPNRWMNVEAAWHKAKWGESKKMTGHSPDTPFSTTWLSAVGELGLSAQLSPTRHRHSIHKVTKFLNSMTGACTLGRREQKIILVIAIAWLHRT